MKNFSKVLCVVAVTGVLGVWPASESQAREFDLSNKDDKETLDFLPKNAGKVVLSGKWGGAAKSLDVALYSPNQLFAHWRGAVTKNPFELSWDFSEKDIEESPRAWKIVLRARGGEAKGEVEISGNAVEAAEEKEDNGSDKKSFSKPSAGKGTEVDRPVKDELPPIALDDFGLRVRRAFLEMPFYKPWVDKLMMGKKSSKIEIRPLGLNVTPAVRKTQSRYGALALTVRNITLTPAQNVTLMESISGSVETRIELLMRLELPGWHLLALQLAPFSAYPGESPRLTALQVETRSLSRGEILPPTSYPLSVNESILLVPILISNPGEYLFIGQPIAREPAEILFVLGGIELYRIGS